MVPSCDSAMFESDTRRAMQQHIMHVLLVAVLLRLLLSTTSGTSLGRALWFASVINRHHQQVVGNIHQSNRVCMVAVGRHCV